MLGVSYGPQSSLYSFPDGHPLNSTRTKLFGSKLSETAASLNRLSVIEPVSCSDQDLRLFQTDEYIEFVRRSSEKGTGFLDYGDTPSFPGVFEASKYTVGSSLSGFNGVLSGEFDHFFNPVGGLHHARRDRAGGFCVFNDCAIAISKAIGSVGLEKVAYVDIDAHHGDGVYYGFEDDPRVFIADIHEDGRFLYPGTGFAAETGIGKAKGTKLNIPLPPRSGDEAFFDAFKKVEEFVLGSKPDFILLQCGADGLRGDPLTHLNYSSNAHAFAAKRLHKIAHEICGGKILAMGGGGYNAENVSNAWMAVVKELCGHSDWTKKLAETE